MDRSGSLTNEHTRPLSLSRKKYADVGNPMKSLAELFFSYLAILSVLVPIYPVYLVHFRSIFVYPEATASQTFALCVRLSNLVSASVLG